MASKSSQGKTLLCIEYPGRVENVTKALATLGGLDGIAKVAEEPNRRLELRFRPDDVFCKPTCGEKTGNRGLVLKVRKLRRKKKNPNDPDEFKLEHTIVATVDNTIKYVKRFKGLMNIFHVIFLQVQ